MWGCACWPSVPAGDSRPGSQAIAALLGGSRGLWAGRQPPGLARQPVVSEIAAPARLAGLSFPGSLGQPDATGHCFRARRSNF